MNELLERAREFLDKNLGYNEVELTDGSLKVRLVRYTTANQYYYAHPYTVEWQVATPQP